MIKIHTKNRPRTSNRTVSQIIMIEVNASKFRVVMVSERTTVFSTSPMFSAFTKE